MLSLKLMAVFFAHNMLSENILLDNCVVKTSEFYQTMIVSMDNPEDALMYSIVLLEKKKIFALVLNGKLTFDPVTIRCGPIGKWDARLEFIESFYG
ncbi:hypothetical protein MHBO_001625 [Bonamia ostreae]|uniref:Uncharacterized protein n=1 Tax=Bonamia ostreae TaxID=126728 RepID=A0ABV2AJN9_9EUKA